MRRRRRCRRRRGGFFFFSGFLFILIIFMVISREVDREAVDRKKEYLDNTTYLAVQTAKNFGLFPSVMLAQSALESNFGNSELSNTNNNYFGIKRGNSKDYVDYKTTEYIDGKAETLSASFRSYKTKTESFEDYARLITGAKRYKSVKNAGSYEEACRALQKSGYATDPRYAEKIISIIERYELHNLD